jgi:hypothetical protein
MDTITEEEYRWFNRIKERRGKGIVPVHHSKDVTWKQFAQTFIDSVAIVEEAQLMSDNTYIVKPPRSYTGGEFVLPEMCMKKQWAEWCKVLFRRLFESDVSKVSRGEVRNSKRTLSEDEFQAVDALVSGSVLKKSKKTKKVKKVKKVKVSVTSADTSNKRAC